MSYFLDLFNKALKLHKQNNILGALKIYLKIIKKENNNINLLYLIGTCYIQIKKPTNAILYFKKALSINENHTASYNNLGGVYFELNRYEESIKTYQKLLKIDPKHRAAKNNLAICFGKLKKHSEAINILHKLLKEEPNNFQVYNNLGNIYADTKKNNLALIHYKKALEINPNFMIAYENLGDLYFKNKEYESSLKMYEKIFNTKQKYSDINVTKILDNIFFTKMKMCDWHNYDQLKFKIIEYINEGKRVTDPFILNSLIDNPKLQKKATEQYIDIISKNLSEPFNSNRKKKKKPKIGYFSGDFKDHAVMHLILDVFKNHNQLNFDYYAFSLFEHEIDEWNINLNQYFTKIINIENMSDEVVANLSRQIDIDIAVDLSGFTQISRPEIFLNRCAPIQINFLGYPGTMGSKYFDYIIADKIVIPENQKKNYTEDIIYMENCYQPNVDQKNVSEKEFKRKDFELPENKFVFCSFNSNYKITPDIFNCWLEIIKNTKNTVLWILRDNKKVEENLSKLIKKTDIEKERVIFTKPIPLDKHLKRISLADLFLDTYPYGGHTTASDAIRMGVPVITIEGESFSSRVASSILNQVNLNDLVTKNINEYKNLAIKIANSNNDYNIIKKKLMNSIKTTTLFDSYKFTKNLESIYNKLSKDL